MTTENENPKEDVVLTGIADPQLRSTIVRPASVIVDIWSPKTGAKFCITGHGLTAKEALQDAFEAIEYGKEVGLTTEFPGEHFQNQYGCITRKEFVSGQPVGKANALPKADPEYVPPVPVSKTLPRATSPAVPEPAKAVGGAWNPTESKSVLFGERVRNPKDNTMVTAWKITNLPHTQFAVRIWPEVLAEAGIMVGDLSLEDQYPLFGDEENPGYTHGEYVNNEKGYPGKVTKLSLK